MNRLPTSRPIHLNRTAEAAADRADEILKIWRVDEATPRDTARTLRDNAAAAVDTGEINGIQDALAMPITGMDLARVVAELLASWPPTAGADISIFSRNMAEDVSRAKPGRAALLLACRSLRARHVFRPSIAEVLAAVSEQQSACFARVTLLARLPDKLRS